MWLAERLETAARAAELLEQKERVLRREQRRLLVLERTTRAAWEKAWRESQTWIARAAALRGRHVISLGARRDLATVELTWRNSMGAFYPAEAACRLPEPRPVRESAGTAAMVDAVRVHREALERAVVHAATNRATTEVDRELRATRRRLRMLRHHWIPALGTAVRSVDIELEERERGDIVHARWAHTKSRSR
ncbi:MAG TPA: V-type ATP synthase subunit D [Acidimicrobiia bacterium]|nr:V-type ATP synthase subunit D [Acidimicrobiia bacterium]